MGTSLTRRPRMAISLKVRQKVLAAVERVEAPASVARRFEIGERSVYRLKRRVREGPPIPPDKTGPDGPIKLTPVDTQLLGQSVDDRPGVTAGSMLPQLSVKVAQCTLCGAWNQLALSLEKSALAPRSRCGRGWRRGSGTLPSRAGFLSRGGSRALTKPWRKSPWPASTAARR